MPKLVLYTERQSGAEIIETKAKYAPSPPPKKKKQCCKIVSERENCLQLFSTL